MEADPSIEATAFVMRALSDLEPSCGIRAMQRINVVVLNPAFQGVFVGTALLALVLVGLSVLGFGTRRSAILLAAALLYLVGCFGVTAAFNVPRNERLARLQAASAEAVEYWPAYVREWGFWNHARTFAAAASAVLAGGAMCL